MTTPSDTAPETDGPDAGEGSAEISMAELRQVIREELTEIVPKFLHSDDTGGGNAQDEGEEEAGGGGEEGLSLRQLTHRALRMTEAALSKIPGPASSKPAEPTRPAAEKKPASRSLRFLGFEDPEK